MTQPADLSVRPPRQRRTRERWERALDAGVELIIEGGEAALTIAALCERADVPPRFVYERVASKEGLFLAVYEHGMRPVLAAEGPFTDDGFWADLEPAAMIEAAVRALAEGFWNNEPWLRSVVLISGEHAEVRRRGSAYVNGLRMAFLRRVEPATTDPVAASTLFELLFSTLTFRVAYGADFIDDTADTATTTDRLVALAHRTLG